MSARRVVAAIALLLPLATAGCVTPGVTYGGGYGVGYYQPSGVVYGGWGPGYALGPVRSGRTYTVPRNPPHVVYRPVPSTRPIPTIPSRARGHAVVDHGHQPALRRDTGRQQGRPIPHH